MKHLFRYWDRIKQELRDKHILLFLDYDGTLTPIVSDPKKALLSRQAKYHLSRLAKSPKVHLAIISGRSLKDIMDMVGLKGIIYSGNHGMEVKGLKESFMVSVSSAYKLILARMKDELITKLSGIKGVFIEDKGLSLSLHYRLVNRKNVPEVKKIFFQVTSKYRQKNKIKIKPGKMVREIRPPTEWNKGRVLQWLLARQRPILKGAQTFCVYLGDDSTDEDAFKVLRKKKGISVFIGKPRQSSYASYYLRNSREVEGLLRRILEIDQGQKICQN